MHWDHKVCDVGLESGARFDDFGPVRVVVVEGSLMMGWAAVVTFEFSGDHLYAFNGVRKVFSIRAW